MSDADEYPEHAKLQKIVHKSQAIGEFLEWLTYEQGYVLARYDLMDNRARLTPAPSTITGLLAEYFDIDQARLEEEKLAMIEAIRKLNES